MIRLILVAFAATLTMGCTNSANTKSADSRIENLKANYSSESVIGLDVRTTEEVASNAATGSINIPMASLEAALAKLDKSKHIYVFCESGGRASRALSILKANGFNKVSNIKDWRTWNQLKI